MDYTPETNVCHCDTVLITTCPTCGGLRFEMGENRKWREEANKWRGIAGTMADMDPWIAEQCGYDAALAKESK